MTEAAGKKGLSWALLGGKEEKGGKTSVRRKVKGEEFLWIAHGGGLSVIFRRKGGGRVKSGTFFPAFRRCERKRKKRGSRIQEEAARSRFLSLA